MRVKSRTNMHIKRVVHNFAIQVNGQFQSQDEQRLLHGLVELKKSTEKSQS